MVKKAKRRDKDFYPTPPCGLEALRLWAERKGLDWTGRWLDPAAGAGSSLHWLGVPKEDRWALELRSDEAAVKDLHHYTPTQQVVVGCNSLEVMWPRRQHIFCNPPFSVGDDFALRCAIETANTPGYTVLLLPTQWWQAQSRAGQPRPRWFLPLAWRLPFSGKGGAMFDVAFAVYEAQPSAVCEVEWLQRPDIPQPGTREGKEPHPVWAEFLALQPDYDALGAEDVFDEDEGV